MTQQILEYAPYTASDTGAFRDDFVVVSFGTNLIYYCAMRLKGLKSAGISVDKKHKEYKDLKKIIKGILKQQHCRGNVSYIM